MNLAVVGEGFTTGISLIIAIGAQNTYVLKKGITKSYVFTIAIICTLIDAFLITIGTLGLGEIIENNRVLILSFTIFGIIFLLSYGIKSIKSCFISNSSLVTMDREENKEGLKVTILTLLGFSLLNPHVYLDTVILIGSVGAKFPSVDRINFVIGACAASAIWFFSLAYGAKLLEPLFRKPITWKILDLFVGLLMFSIVGKLIMFFIENL